MQYFSDFYSNDENILITEITHWICTVRRTKLLKSTALSYG